MQPQDMCDRVSPEEWVTFRRCRFVPRTFTPYSCLAARDGGGWGPYRGQPFDPSVWKLVEGGWDHEHCDVCSARIADGAAYWANAGPEHVDLCPVCYPLVRAALGAEPGAAPDTAI
ncbi:MAG TPA: hypothetical protein VGE74_02850 [Gemmata sp.]